MSDTLTMLHVAYAGPGAAKRMARDGRVAVKTAEKWWQHLTTPRPDTLLRMTRENETLRAELIRRLEAHGYGSTPTPGEGSPAGEAGDGRAVSAAPFCSIAARPGVFAALRCACGAAELISIEPGDASGRLGEPAGSTPTIAHCHACWLRPKGRQ